MTVDIVIIQPKSGGIKTWSVSAVYLRSFINSFNYAAHQALSDSPQAVAGKHCKWCKAITDCTENKLEVAKVFNNVKQITEPSADDLDMLYYAKQMINDKLMVVEALAMVNPPQGYEIGTGRGRKAWTADDSIIRDTGLVYGVDLMKEPAPITPTQAINAGMPKEVINTMSKFYSGKPQLKKIDMKKLNAAFKQEN